jgi:hypothetical protein
MGTRHNERAEFPGHFLHVSNVDARGDDGQFTVWLNTEASDFDGLCLGIADTRDEAVAQAVQSLERALEILQGGPAIGPVEEV